jgi:hypothetical protein
MGIAMAAPKAVCDLVERFDAHREGEDVQLAQTNLKFAQKHMLPDLANNIKCGNSLIGPDFYQSRQTEFDDEESYRINACDWNAEFPKIMGSGSDKGLQPLVPNPPSDQGLHSLVPKTLPDKGLQPLVRTQPPPGGFDAVIGNPPYGFVFAKSDLPYLASRFRTFASVQDGYVAFVEKAHILLRDNGHFGYIIPSAWLGGPSYLPLRRYLLTFRIGSVILLPYDVSFLLVTKLYLVMGLSSKLCF